MKTVCVIPARYGSTRLQAKMLRTILGKPLLGYVIENARQLKCTDWLLVATDHEEIAAIARQYGATPVMTDPELPSGTDRVFAAIKETDADIVINLQGDEPLMPAAALDLGHAALINSNESASTGCVPITDRTIFDNPMVVKVVRDNQQRALYFSRSPIPSPARRDEGFVATTENPWGYKHLGFYIYRRAILEKFCGMPTSSLENAEKLEQLRLLQNGTTLLCIDSPGDSIGVDTEHDLKTVEAILKAR